MRCCFEGCNKKINITQQISNKCRCELIFCNNHKSEGKHNCKYQFKPLDKKDILKDKELFIKENKCMVDKVIKV